MRPLDDQLRRYVDAAAIPVTPAEARGRASDSVSRTAVRKGAARRRFVRSISVAALLVMIAVVVAFALLSGDGGKSSVQTATRPADPNLIRDRAAGFAVRIPSGWPRDEFTSIGSLFSVSSSERTRLCDGSFMPSAFVSVNEIRIPKGDTQVEAVARPIAFGPDSGTIEQAATPAPDGCPVLPPAQNIFFTDKGRTFQAFMRFYEGVPDARVTEAYEILDSLRFVSKKKLDRRPASASTTSSTTSTRIEKTDEIKVLVLNGSGATDAENLIANDLRRLGYGLAGTGTAPTRDGNLVQCRAGFARRAQRLAEVPFLDAIIEPFPVPAPDIARTADCIVTVGG